MLTIFPKKHLGTKTPDQKMELEQQFKCARFEIGGGEVPVPWDGGFFSKEILLFIFNLAWKQELCAQSVTSGHRRHQDFSF